MIQRSEEQHLSMQRLNNLIDGIFAIAMTILVLNIDTPVLKESITSQVLWEALSNKGHVFFNYILSFYILGSIWVAQVHHTRHVARTKRRYIWLNLFALMLVCLVPFTTDVAGSYPAVPVAKVVFHCNLFLVGMAYLIEDALIRRDEHLLFKTVTEEDLRRSARMSLLLPSTALAGLLLTPFWTEWSSLAYMAIPVLHLLLSRMGAHSAKK